MVSFSFRATFFQGTTRGQHRSSRTIDARLTCSVCRQRPWPLVQQHMASSPCHCGSPCLPRAIAKPSPSPKHTTCCHERTAKHGEELLGPLRKIAAAAHTDGHSHRSEFGKTQCGRNVCASKSEARLARGVGLLSPSPRVLHLDRSAFKSSTSVYSQKHFLV